MGNWFFLPQMDESNFLEEMRNWEHPPWYGRTTQFEEKVKEIFLENQKGLHFHHLKTFPDACPINDFWSGEAIHVDFYRHHVESRVKLYSPREESFFFPLKYMDVTRTTHTNLDLMQESRIEDYWHIDESRDLSDSWTGFTLLEEKPPDGYMWSGGRLTKRQATSRPDHLWPELWTKLGRNAKLREKRKVVQWKTETQQCQKITRNLFSWPWGEGINSKKPLGLLERNWKHQWLPICLARYARKLRKGRPVARQNDFKSKFACILEASESTRLRMEESLPSYHEDHNCRKRRQFTATMQFGTHNLFLCLKPWRFSQQKQQWIKNGRNMKRFRRETWQRSEVNQRWSIKQGRSSFCLTDGHL